MIEEWRPIPDWPAYEVSNLGAVRAVDRAIQCSFNGQTPYVQNKKGRLLTRRRKGIGYYVVTLRTPGKRKTALVHRLVATAFIPNLENKPSINHIDNDPGNNVVTNLEWCTQAENIAHMDSCGRRVSSWTGKRSPYASLNDEIARSIRDDRETYGLTLQALAAKYGTNKRTVGRILSGESYSLPPSKQEG